MKQKNKKGMLIALFVFCGLAAGVSVAYYLSQENTVKNTFKLAQISCKIEEKFDSYVKEDVAVRNTGEFPAYIRVVFIPTWMKEEDNSIYSKTPVEGVDYTLTGVPSSDWIKIGDYYYYIKPVPAGSATSKIFDSCEPVAKNVPEGYQFSIDIVASAIQGEPIDAVKEAWGVNVDTNGNITVE